MCIITRKTTESIYTDQFYRSNSIEWYVYNNFCLKIHNKIKKIVCNNRIESIEYEVISTFILIFAY